MPLDFINFLIPKLLYTTQNIIDVLTFTIYRIRRSLFITLSNHARMNNTITKCYPRTDISDMFKMIR